MKDSPCFTSVKAGGQELTGHSGDGIEQIAAARCGVMIPHDCGGAGSAARMMMMMIIAFCYIMYT